MYRSLMCHQGIARRVGRAGTRVAAAGVIAACALTAQAGIFRKVCVLQGIQEVPANASTAVGCGTFVVDTSANTVTYYIVVSGLSTAETAAHIHGPAAPGVNAGVKTALPVGNKKMGVWAYAAADEPDILAGRMYVNVHSTMFGGGEVRGQIVDYVAVLDGLQETPANGSAGTGFGLFQVNTCTNTMDYYIGFGGLGFAETAAHIHGLAPHGTAAGVKFALPAGSPKVGSVVYVEGDEKALQDGLMYVNIHSAGFPGGEIRGQITRIVSPMDGSQEVPANASTAAGCGLYSIDRGADRLGYHVRFAGLGSAQTAAHIHGYAAPGANAGVKFGLALGSPVTGAWTYPAAEEPMVVDGLTYTNVHTTGFGGGEIRGQIVIPPYECPGDSDFDGMVGNADLQCILDSWSSAVGDPEYNPCCDFDGNGMTENADLQVVLDNWAMTCPR